MSEIVFTLKAMDKSGKISRESFGSDYMRAQKVAARMLANGMVFVDFIAVKDGVTIRNTPVRIQVSGDTLPE